MRASALASSGAPLLLGCAPMVEVLGVYFPAWLVSTVSGVALAYLAVWGLARHEGARSLAESGVFFVSLALASALSIWWLLFGRF